MEVNVFPNPARQSATFKLSSEIEGDVQLNLYDLTGRLVDTKKYNSPSFVWERNTLTRGMYTYEIINNKVVIAIGKLIVR